MLNGFAVVDGEKLIDVNRQPPRDLENPYEVHHPLVIGQFFALLIKILFNHLSIQRCDAGISVGEHIHPSAGARTVRGTSDAARVWPAPMDGVILRAVRRSHRRRSSVVFSELALEFRWRPTGHRSHLVLPSQALMYVCHQSGSRERQSRHQSEVAPEAARFLLSFLDQPEPRPRTRDPSRKSPLSRPYSIALPERQ